MSICRFLLGCIVLLSVSGPLSAASFRTPEGRTLEESAPPVELAKDCRALVPVVVSPESSEDVRRTAAFLAESLGRITGAEFSVTESREPVGITLGTLAQFPDSALDKSLAIRDTYDGVEAFGIRSDGGRVRLLGNTDLGVSHAANRFLELLGRRVFFMGPNWEILPESKTLAFALNETSRPRIWSRKLAFTRMNIKGEDGDRDRRGDFQRWREANLMGESLGLNTSHAWHAIPNAFKAQGFPFQAEFEAHPEYFALVDGQRKPPQFCVTNPGLQKIVTRYANQYFEVNPKADMVSLDTADQANWCTCSDCQKLGPHGDQAFYLANLVAKDLQKTHPGKYVGILAYSWHSDPPQFVLEPNVFVMLTAGMNASSLSFDELFDAWITKCGRLGIYEYFTYWEMDKCMLPGKGPHLAIDNLPMRIRRYADNGVVGFIAESASAWGTHGLGYYITAKLLWDPTADVEALRRDFAEKAFGPAAPAMLSYWRRLDLSHNPLRGVAQLRGCLEDLREATKLAQGRSDVLARLDDLKAVLIYTALGVAVEMADEESVQKERALEWFQWAYRIRNTHMIDWITFRAAVGNNEYERTLAAKFNEPSWNYRKSADNPWRDDRPVTRQEIEERLDALATAWGEVPKVAAADFSGDYVLVAAPEETQAVRKRQAFIGMATFLLASPKGEPLSFKLHSVPSPKIERQNAKYTLGTLEGKTLESGELPEGDNELTFKVPGPGVYRFSCKRGGGGWNIDLPDTIPAALVVERGTEFRPQFMKTYFYVPRGTKKFAVYSQDGGIAIQDPDGQKRLDGRTQGDIRSVTVGAGQDGRMWTLTGKTRNLWFLNIPTVLASDPQSVFVPKELILRDELKPVVP